MLLPKILTYKSVRSRSIIPNASPTKPSFHNYLQEAGIEKLKSSISYNKYLNELRSIESQLVLVKKPKTLKLLRKHKQRNIFNQNYVDIFKDNGQEVRDSYHQQQINGSFEIDQSEVTQNIVNISEDMDQSLEKGLNLPIVNTKKSINMKNEVDIHNTKNKYHSDNNDTQKSQNEDTRDNKRMKYHRELQWGKEGLSLDIINRTLLQKVNIISKGQNKLEKLRNRKFRKSRKKQGDTNSIVKARDNLMLSEGWTDHLSNASKRNNKIISQDKQNNHAVSQYQDQLNSSKTKNKKLQSPQDDLLTVFQNYREKCKLFGMNKKLMTEKRQQAIFTNELMKVARKYESLDQFSSLLNNKEVEIKNRSQSGLRKEQKELQGKEMRRMPTCSLRQMYRKQFAEISRMNIHKL